MGHCGQNAADAELVHVVSEVLLGPACCKGSFPMRLSCMPPLNLSARASQARPHVTLQIHRDIKPANFLIDRAWKVKVCA